MIVTESDIIYENWIIQHKLWKNLTFIIFEWLGQEN